VSLMILKNKTRYSTMKFYRFNLWFVLMLLILIVSVSVGFRPEAVGSDTPLYSEIYTDLLNSVSPLVSFEYLYDFLAIGSAQVGLPVGAFFTLISLFGFSAVFFLARLIGCYLNDSMAGSLRLFVLLTIFLLASPFFFSSQVNVIRHGVSILFAQLFLVGLVCHIKRHWLLVIAVVSIGFHYTAFLYIGLSVLLLLPYWALLLLLGISFVSYITGTSEAFVLLISSLSAIDFHGKISDYGAGSDYVRGVRLDFALFTMSLGVITSFIVAIFIRKKQALKVLNLSKVYWVLALPFFYAGFGAYSDRYLLGAWLYLSVIFGVLMFISTTARQISLSIFLVVLFLSVLFFVVRAQGLILTSL
jgi:hypothetical protein